MLAAEARETAASAQPVDVLIAIPSLLVAQARWFPMQSPLTGVWCLGPVQTPLAQAWPGVVPMKILGSIRHRPTHGSLPEAVVHALGASVMLARCRVHETRYGLARGSLPCGAG